MPISPVRTVLFGFCAALALGGPSCGIRTELGPTPETSTGTSKNTGTSTLTADASPQPGAGQADAGVPQPPASTPDAAFGAADAPTGPSGGSSGSSRSDAQIPPVAPEAGPGGTVRNADASIPRGEVATPVPPVRDGGIVNPGTLGDAGTGFLAPDVGGRGARDAGVVVGRDAAVVVGSDAGLVFPGSGNDGGLAIPTRPDGGLGRQGNDAGVGRGREAGNPGQRD